MDFNDIETGPVFWTLVLIFGAIGLVIFALFLLNLRNLLNEVSTRNRAMQPNRVWLNFIPIFSWVWMIITVIKVRDSIRAEFQARGWVATGDFGFGVGLAFAIMSIFAGGFLYIPWLVCFVIYWIRTAEVKKQLKAAQPPVGWNAPAAPPPAPYVGTPSAPYAGTPPAVDSEAQAKVETLSTPESQTFEPTADPQVVCPVCGVENRQNAKFCRSCGRSF